MTRPIIEYDPNAKITVSEPTKASSGVVGNHTQYKVKGNNADGDFDELRRFKEFYSLRNLLSSNWPGFYIPAIPPKVKIGKMDENLVQERCYLFNRFMKDISEIPHLWNSDEVKTFIKPNMPVSQGLSLIPAPTAEEIFTKISKVTAINAQDIDDSKLSRYSDSIRDFVINSKEIFPLLSKFKNCIAQLEKQRCYQLDAYKHFSEFLSHSIFMCLPFFSIYATRILGMHTSKIGYFISAQMIGSIVSNIFWGYYADRRGAKFIIVITNVLSFFVPFVSLFIKTPILFIVVFFLMGAYLHGTFIGYTNYLLKIAPEKYRPTYVSIRGTFNAMSYFLPTLGGLIADRFSFLTLFLISSVLSLVALVNSLALKD